MRETHHNRVLAVFYILCRNLRQLRREVSLSVLGTFEMVTLQPGSAQEVTQRGPCNQKFASFFCNNGEIVTCDDLQGPGRVASGMAQQVPFEG